MANPKENNETTSQNKKVDYGLIQLSIPEIISALHQKAIASCPSDLRIANSAIEGDGKSAKLNSAGQHIVSVLAAKEGDKVEKSKALKTLQDYVKAFVGPDLAKKVTDKTLMELGSSDSEENENQEQKDENNKDQENQDQQQTDNAQQEENKENSNTSNENQDDAKKENTQQESIQIKSFQRFLIENCGMKFLFEENNEQQDDSSANKEEKAEENKEDKGNKEEALGWYIAYNLKVQGLKETNLKDAMKDFATSFFDNLKLTASGLFGGSQTITGNDIRKGFHNLLHVDHTKLASNVAEYLRKKFPNVEDTSVEARDSKTLYKEIKDYINKDEKTAVNSAAYCLRIKVREEDRKKPFFNKKKIAEVIRKCMAGFRLGKKAAVTEDSIIKIEDFKDKNDNKEEARNSKRPDSIQIKTIFSSDAIKKKLGDDILNLKPDTKIKNGDAIKIYDEIRKKFKASFSPDALKEKENKEAKKIVDDLEASIKSAKDSPIEAKAFIDFYDKYLNFEKSIGESKATFDFIRKNDVMKSILELLFEDFQQKDLEPSQILGEEDEEDANEESSENGDVKSEKCKKSLEDIKTQWKTLVNKSSLKSTNENAKGFIVSKDDILSQLASFSNVDKLKSEFDKNKEFNYGIAVDLSKTSVLAESQQQFMINSICNLLFEEREKKTRENLNQNDKDFLEVRQKYSHGKLKYPIIFDATTEKKREMTSAEVKSALQNGTLEYDGSQLKVPDLKKLVSDVALKNSANSANSQKPNFDVFDSIKEFTNLSDQSFGQLIKLTSKDQNESNRPDDGNLILEKGHKEIDDKKWQEFKKTIKSNLEDIRNRKDEILKKSYEDQGQMLSFTRGEEAENNSYNDFVKELFDSSDSADDTIKKLNKIVHRNNFRNDIVYRFKYEPNNEEETVKITFYDSDPESGNKKEKALGDSIEVKKGDSIDSSEEIQKKKEEYEKQLKDNQQEGYNFDGWNPDTSSKANEDTDLVAKYQPKNEEEEPEKFLVVFKVLTDPADAKSKLINVKVHDVEWQEVEKGKNAILPEKKDIPEHDGYDFIDWGDAEEKLKNVTEDIVAVGRYQKHIDENAVFVMPFAYYQSAGEDEDIDFGNSDDGDDDDGSSNNVGGNDLYVFPIASSKDFESAPEAGND